MTAPTTTSSTTHSAPRWTSRPTATPGECGARSHSETRSGLASQPTETHRARGYRGSTWRDRRLRIQEVCAIFVDACEEWGQFRIEACEVSSDVGELLERGSEDSRAPAEWASDLRHQLDHFKTSSDTLSFVYGSHKEYDSVFYELIFWEGL